MFLRSVIFLLLINTIGLQAGNSRTNYDKDKSKFELSDCQKNKRGDEGYNFLCFDDPNPQSINLNFLFDRATLTRELKEGNNSCEDLWVLEFFSDIKDYHAHERLSGMAPLKDIASFSNEHPVLQSLAAVIILEGLKNKRFSKFGKSLCPINRRSNPKAFALELMAQAATVRHYITAKKLLVSYFYEVSDTKNLIYWLHSLACDGSSDAMREFMRIYGLGIGVKKSTKVMLMWLCLSADYGDNQAVKIMNFYNKWYYDCQDLIEAKKLALQWKEKYIERDRKIGL
jgi:hypothetical protein